jgi:hypothetical protein
MNNKIIGVLIPVIAVIIIFESIFLVSNLEKKSDSTVVETVTQVPTITTTEQKEETNAFELNFSTDETQMKIGKKYKVSVNVMPKNNVNLNALDLYVKYDPTMVTVSSLTSSKNLQTPSLIKVSDKKNIIVVNYLFSDENGTVFTKNTEETLLTFTVIPKTTGSSYFEISTGDNEGDSVTMFIDRNTSKNLNFISNKLEVLLTN